ncbi:ABC transporter permease [Truepera radiovictrix]|uniref:Binding-protein-dependent transport systems inner membrane component n=1 Tax=Truepera radiovictrix (strain DSM 17093 / CIP 108686 / LMG 22925 / RQ-24) TaxID=649638 RepID=D7CXU0_TRURR|nr:ABC transporter permease [Truepera radiovictrix]ADI13300.1 binding-protein-dependent transport systems inner membrane component [Truepera radiovictrix DSM 17093]WMT58136.1 ABC transporter permease [Truepera radiovictrix]
MFSVFKDLLRYNTEFAIGVVLVGVVVVYAGLSFFSSVDPTLMYTVMPDMAPSAEHWFGTNSRGQDMFWQLSFAFRNTLVFGLLVVVLSRIISITVGLVSGYLGGATDRALMFVNDIFVALPIFPILVLFYFTMRSDLNTVNLAFLMACLGWPFDARLIRSVALGLRHREFTRHAVFSGMSARKIMFEEHLPYVMPIIFSTAMANLIWAIGLEVTLAVLGFTNINIPTVGTTIYWANNHSALVVGVWWWVVIPVVLIVMLFIGLFLLAVSINEYIDPRSRLRRMERA